ncbi:MAG TPA: TylF/MycF/NovP-related O-methyltransferase [Nocardioides sp.]|jgi:hypothetical protein|nr:TylF/MycF/NovP-related O-methyltransferase [Nocardioides sp.]
MSWRRTANSLLLRATGYSLTRPTPHERGDGSAAAPRKEQRERRLAERRAERATRVADAEARRSAVRAERRAAAAAAGSQREAHRRARLVARFDEQLCSIVDRVQPQTMTSPEKIAALVEATRYVSRHGIPGAVVECGVWRGGSMKAVALTLLDLGDTTRDLHLFDTFEGMPPPDANDARTTEAGAVPAEELLAASDKESLMWAVAGLDVVKETMAETDYPSERVHFHPGLVEDTTPEQAPDTIAILRLDTDWYASTKHELEHLYHRLSPGGVLILDDYGGWDGARKATDEWLEQSGEPIFLAPMGAGRIAIKPLTNRA